MGIVIALALYTLFVSVYWRKYILILVTVFSLGCIGYTHACDFVFTRVLQPHQRIRIEVLLGMKEDPAGAGYNVNQARIAIGSGRFFGKGYLKGTQTKLQFVPEQDTDFIFCTIGEEWGFFGSAFVVLLYMAFIPPSPSSPRCRWRSARAAGRGHGAGRRPATPPAGHLGSRGAPAGPRRCRG